jgi:hypothetical protein
MCSKKWAKPDLPGSTSLRDPVCTGMCTETRLGKPVGTTMTFSPLGSSFSVALNGSTSPPVAALAAVGVADAAWTAPATSTPEINVASVVRDRVD